jgi:glucose-6-phosphate isomerase
VQATLARMAAFTAAVHGGAIHGATGARFTDVLNIGIGGSDLGPAMAARALWKTVSAAGLHAQYHSEESGKWTLKTAANAPASP